MTDEEIIEVIKSSLKNHIDVSAAIFDFYNHVFLLISKQLNIDICKLIKDIEKSNFNQAEEWMIPILEVVQKRFVSMLESRDQQPSVEG